MAEPITDDPSSDERWCEGQRLIVSRYLDSQGIEHGRVGEWPAWHVAPYASIWAIGSLGAESIGWWVICGDLPTDYISSVDVESPQHPRKAMHVFAKRWLELVDAWRDGRELADIWIDGPVSHDELAPLLKSRATLLAEWAGNDSLWEET